MEIELIKKVSVIISILLFTLMSVFAQQGNKEEYTVVSIDSIYLENKGSQLALNKITSKNIQSFLGKPVEFNEYKEEWSDEYDKTTIYKYKLLTICFRSLEKEEWLNDIECSNPEISVIINGVHLSTGIKDLALNVFEKSWETYQELKNTKHYQNRVKQGYTEKTFIVEFSIKKENYEYHGLIYISVKDETIIKMKLYLQDEA